MRRRLSAEGLGTRRKPGAWLRRRAGAAAGIDRTPHRDITPPWYFIGAASFLYGFFDLVEHTPFEIAFIAAAAAFVYASVALRSRTLLFVATLGILAYTGWFTRQYFADSIGWPQALGGPAASPSPPPSNGSSSSPTGW